MQKGIRKPVYFPDKWDLEMCFQVSGAHGYEGMELIFRSGIGPVQSVTRSELIGNQDGYRSWQSLGASVTFDTTEKECKNLKNVAAGYGISIVGLASGYSPIDEPGSPTFILTHEYICKAIERSHWLGGQHVLISFEKYLILFQII